MTAFETTSCAHDGVAMDGFLARPAGGKGPHPTVILFPGAGGTGPTFESNITRLRNGFDNVQRVARGEPALWVVPELLESKT